MQERKIKILPFLADNGFSSLAYSIGAVTRTAFLPLQSGALNYMKFYGFLDRSQWWSKDQLLDYQDKQLQHMVRYCYDNVPYYTRIFNELDLTPEDINSTGDLRKLPVLTKDDIADYYEELIAKNITPEKLIKYGLMKKTSGSSGKPMKFYLDRSQGYRRLAFSRWRKELAGVKERCRFIQLWSRPFIEGNLNESYIYDPFFCLLSLRTAPADEQIFKDHLERIRSFKPRYIQGPPSFLYQLAVFAGENNINDVKFPVLLSSCENMYPYQETAIREQFGCRILRYYVSEESVFLAAECASHGSMHIDMRKGIMEVVDASGDILPEGAPGRIICTGFNNSIMPLIRYDTGDTGTISPEACPCGRGLAVLQSLDGRTSEIMRFGNRFIFPASLSVIIDDIENMLECQFIQESETELTVNIVPGRSYEEKDSDSIKHKLAELVGDDVSIRLSFSDNIPRTPLGKFQFVITRSPESRD